MDILAALCYKLAPTRGVRLQAGSGIAWRSQFPRLCNATQPTNPEVTRLLVQVRDNNVDQALKALKKKMQREGIFREMKLRNYYEKPSEKRVREQAEAVRRARKLARKRAQREGLLPGKAAGTKPGAKAPGRPGAPRTGAGGPPRSGGLGAPR
jgi:small subunit ribosomal protein S21